MNITIISGSPRRESISYRAAQFLTSYFSAHYPAHQFQLVDVRAYPLPFVDKVFSSLESTPQEWKPLAEIIFKTDAFVLVTPEYNGSYSPAMKNLLDHFPKQSRKVFGIVSSSTGVMGGMRAAQQMQQMICAFFGIACPNMLLIPTMDKKFDLDGNLIDDSFLKNITSFASEFVWLAEAIFQKKQAGI